MASPARISSPTDLAWSAEEIQVLEDNKIFTSPARNGKRTVSVASLSPPLTISSSSSSHHFQSLKNLQNQTADIPEALDSPATLVWIGFTSEVAEEIYDRWTHRGEDSPFDLMRFVDTHISLTYNRFRNHDFSDEDMMIKIGYNKAARDALLDPEHQDIYMTRTLRYWLPYLMRVRYRITRAHQNIFKQTAQDILKRATQDIAEKMSKHKKRKSIQEKDVFQPAGSSSTKASTSQDKKSALEAEEQSGPKSKVGLLADAPGTVEGTKTLFRGSFYDTDVEMDGSLSLNLNTQLDPNGGDFNFLEPAMYFALDRSVAEKYRHFCERNFPTASTMILRIDVPSEFINGLSHFYLNFDDDWEEFVWHCRTGDGSITAVTPPARFNHWLAAELLQGPICKKHNSHVHHIPREQLVTNITSDYLMTNLDGHRAQQLAFKAREGMPDRLSAAVGENYWIQTWLAKGDQAA